MRHRCVIVPCNSRRPEAAVFSNGGQKLRSNIRDMVDDRSCRVAVTKDLYFIAVFPVIDKAVCKQLIYGVFHLALLQNGRIRRHRDNQHRQEYAHESPPVIPTDQEPSKCAKGFLDYQSLLRNATGKTTLSRLRSG